MRLAEIVAAAVVGALLLGVGYELGRSAEPVQNRQVEPFDRELLMGEIDAMVEDEVARQVDELAEVVISRVEELISERPRRGREPVEEPAGSGGVLEKSPVEQLGDELDKLLSRGLAQKGRGPAAPGAQEESEERLRRRREPFDSRTLQEFEKARKRQLEERRRKVEKEEKRGK